MKELSLFTGMGGGIYGSLILGWETVAYVEQDEYCQKVIKQRQQDGWFDKGNIYGDISEFNRKYASRYTGSIDVLTGGFPCQPFSVAGKRKGTSDERYLFNEIIKTIKIVQPRRCLFENVPGILISNAIIEIYKSLDKIGYKCKPPLVLGSADCGNIHKRERVWILAYAKSLGQRGRESEGYSDERSQCKSSEQEGCTVRSETSGCAVREVHDTNDSNHRGYGFESQEISREQRLPRSQSIRGIEDLLSRPSIPAPLFCGVDDELSDWKQQLKAVGNGQDPIVMATAWNLLTQGGEK